MSATAPKREKSEPSDAAAEWVDPSTLTGWTKNPRKNKSAIERVAESIRKFGFGAPIVARRANREVIAGHTRLQAAHLLKLRAVPVRFLDLDERQAHQLSLADNKLGEIAEWDEDALAQQLSELNIGEAAVVGWSPSDLGKLLEVPEPDEDVTNQLGAGLKYQVIIECTDESHQAELLERFEAEGLSSRPLIS